MTAGPQRTNWVGLARGSLARALTGPVLGVVAVAMLVACKGNQECEAARLELTQTWETLRDTATSRKQIPEASGLSKGEEADRMRVWADIEDRAELLRSSFQTSQVTWPSADKARADLGRTFAPLTASADPMTRGFAITLAEADKRLDAFRKNCR